MKNKIILLQGGISEEREVSLETCSAIKNALENLGKTIRIIDPKDFLQKNSVDYFSMLKKIKKAKFDIIFNGLHGGDGEDGTIQKKFEDAKIDFTGSNSYSSSLSMDKIRSKILVQKMKIPVPNFLQITKENKEKIKNDLKKLSFPIVVKPNSSGSSVGITIVEKEKDFSKAIKTAFNFDNKVLAEKYIKGREITVAILGDKALPVVEVKPKNGWYDYLHKYTKGETIYEVPAKISKQKADEVTSYAIRIYKKFQCRDYVRIDFRFDGENFYFLEVNTLPGMTKLSLVPMAAATIGITFDELINHIIEKDF